MARCRTLLVLALTAGLAVPALAGPGLASELATAIGTAPADPVASKGKGAAPARPGWTIPNDGSRKDAPCAMSYRDGLNLMGYIGPFKGWDESYFFVSGPNVPFADRPRKRRVALVSVAGGNQTVEAFSYPLGDKRYALLFKLTDFAEALDAMDDEEDVAVLLMEETDFHYRQALFSGSWTGGHAAREKIRACLARQDRERRP